MFGLGIGELVVIGLFALLFIGPKKLPELAKGLGRGIREFQKAKDEIVKSVKDPEYGTTEDDTQQVAHNDAGVFECEQETAEEEHFEDNADVDSCEDQTQSPKLASIARGDLPSEDISKSDSSKTDKEKS